MTNSKLTGRVSKPHPKFPLWQQGDAKHPDRLRWAKRVRKKFHYFGKVAEDPKGEKALSLWLEQKDDLLAGRTPRARGDAVTLADVVNPFLEHKERLRDSGELAPRTFDRYKATGKMLGEFFGRNRRVDDLTPADFESLRASMAKKWGAIVLANEIQIVRSIFRYADEAGIIEKPIRFGPGFKKPSAKVLRQTRAAKGPKMFEADQIRKLLDKASPRMAAMILLAINGGLGPGDLAALTLTQCNSATRWLDYPRVKTGIPRRIPLWPETLAAIGKATEARREPKNASDAELLFIGGRGKSYLKWYRVAAEFSHLLTECGITGRTFYDLRRTFQTIAEGAHDLVAVQSIMGHAPASGDMGSIYRQRIEDGRLEATTGHVRSWLYAEPVKRKDKAEADKPTVAKRRSPKAAAVNDQRPALRIVG